MTTYLVRRGPGLKQVTDRAEAKSFPTSLLRDPGGRKTLNGEKQQREDAKAAATSRDLRGQQRKFTGKSLSLMVKLENTPQPQPILLLKTNGCWACLCNMETGGREQRGECLLRLLKAC